MNDVDMLEDMSYVRSILGYCPQFDALIPLLTGREHLILFSRIRGVPEKEIDSYVTNIIERIGITKFSEKPAGGYSGGNKRKLSIGERERDKLSTFFR